MRLFKTTYRDRNGKTKEVKKWYVEIRDHQDKARRFSAFEDKAASRKFGEKLERLATCRMLRESPDRDLLQWIQGLPGKLTHRLKELGLIDKRRAAAGEPLEKHIKDFCDSLRAMGRTSKHINDTQQGIKDVFSSCDFRVWSDITAAEVEQCLLRQRKAGLSHRTSNYKLQAVKQYANWMISNARAEKSPVEQLKPLNVELDRRRERRALSIDELRTLLESTRKGKRRFNMTGMERSLLYHFAAETGFRARELKHLKAKNFDFETLTVSQEAQFCKNRRDASQPISPTLAAMLKKHLETKTPNTPAFHVPARPAEMLKVDLKAAGIEYVVDGKFFDFHSLRVQLGTLLYESNVHPRLAMEIMRHSKIDMTMKIYSKVKDSQKHRAIANLPNLTKQDTAG